MTLQEQLLADGVSLSDPVRLSLRSKTKGVQVRIFIVALIPKDYLSCSCTKTISGDIYVVFID